MSRACQFLLQAFLTIVAISLLTMPWVQVAKADGPLKVEYSFDPATPEATKASHLKVRVYDAQGKAISNAKVMFSADMPHSAGGSMSMSSSMQPVMLEARPEGQPGQYVADPTFSMTGSWDAKIEVESSSGKSTESFTVKVVDPPPLTGISWPVIGGAGLVLVLLIAVPVFLRIRNRT